MAEMLILQMGKWLVSRNFVPDFTYSGHTFLLSQYFQIYATAHGHNNTGKV